MSFVVELTYILNNRRYSSLTFSIDGIPIVTVNFGKDRIVDVIINNMEELRYYRFKFESDDSKLADEIENVLIYSGVDEIVRKSDGSKITFHAEPYLNGEIKGDEIVIEQGEVSLDEEHGEVLLHKRYEIDGVIEISGHTLAEIIRAFALQFYV